jgi:hypothetical protein
VNRFTGSTQVVTTVNYNTVKIAVTKTHEIKSSYLVSESLLGNESFLVNDSTVEVP